MAEIHKKLMAARLKLHGMGLEKTGENKFAGYKYFELADFLIPAQEIFAEVGLCGVVSFTADTATMTITDADSDGVITITSPMGSAALKGCHEVQNIGAVETYQRRYLWVAALEIVEHDALNATTGNGSQKVTPADGAWEAMDADAQEFLLKAAAWLIDAVKNGKMDEAVAYWREQKFLPEEEIALWTRMDSKTRTPLKKALEAK